MSAPTSWERAQRLYEKNIELENKRRKSAQARVPSDPNAWQQIRENYEAMILEDQDFSEKHNIESALWHFHYRRIEEFRVHLNAAPASSGSNASQGVKGPPRPDRSLKIRQQFKSFLSEATGFYHDLIIKIRAKYGLSLGYFSDNSEAFNVLEKEGKSSLDMKKGLISCHRCLIYLGDLARYKKIHGEGQSRSCDFAAANSYYMQAASLWPSSGNPHNQLAILAIYSGDELVAVYRYFRSLAVENPFSTARDNLTIAFEKNHLKNEKLLGKVKATAVQEARVEGKGDSASASKDAVLKPNLAKESLSTIHDVFKSFCSQFVCLNGILFTQTGLETFADVLSSVSSGFSELLSSGSEEKLIFGTDAAENGLLIVRIVAILIYTIYNAKREAEGRSYAEIVQRVAVLQNSCTATFEIMGHISQRCAQLQDPSSSYLLPGITVFLEWLACSPYIMKCDEIDEKQAAARSNFWIHCISLLNKILSVVPLSLNDDVDDTFLNLVRYEEGEKENRLALYEDFELRGFLPLLPAQTILDFTRKHPYGGDGSKEKKARVKRILSAAKALTHVVSVNDKVVHFDSKLKKFVIGCEPQKSNIFVSTEVVLPVENPMVMENQVQDAMTSGFLQEKQQLTAEIEEEDEVIVFKPSVAEKHMDVLGSGLTCYKNVDQGPNAQNVLVPGVQTYDSSSSRNTNSFLQQTVFKANTPHTSFAHRVFPRHPQVSQSHSSTYLVGEDHSLLTGLGRLKLMDNGHVVKPVMQESMGILQSAALSLPHQQSHNANAMPLLYNQMKFPEALPPSNMNMTPSSAIGVESLAAKPSTASQAGLKKNPVSRPARHLGPPPGFHALPSKQLNGPASVNINSEMPIVDDYSWLDGYQVSAPMKAPGLNASINHTSNFNPQNVNNSNGLTGTISSPFPGNYGPMVLNGMEIQEQLMQKPQHVMNGNHQFPQLPEQYHGQGVWTSRPFV